MSDDRDLPMIVPPAEPRLREFEIEQTPPQQIPISIVNATLNKLRRPANLIRPGRFDRIH